MNLLKGEAKYADVMELALYNGAISGISISGDQFFYQNPLASKGGQRSSWIGLSCCPTNLARFIPQVGGFAYAQQQEKVYVNLYVAGEATIELEDGTTVKLRQTTDYPWDGRVRVDGRSAAGGRFHAVPAHPGLGAGPSRSQRSVPLRRREGPAGDAEGQRPGGRCHAGSDGYVHLTRRWQAGDRPCIGRRHVELELPMPIQRVYAHEKVEEDRGKVALMRGPIVYCLEAVDHDGADVARVVLPRNHGLESPSIARNCWAG